MLAGKLERGMTRRLWEFQHGAGSAIGGVRGDNSFVAWRQTAGAARAQHEDRKRVGPWCASDWDVLAWKLSALTRGMGGAEIVGTGSGRKPNVLCYELRSLSANHRSPKNQQATGHKAMELPW